MEVMCINKRRNKDNLIYAYDLVDGDGTIKTFTTRELKHAVRNGFLTVRNLTMTSDGRLVDKKKS